MYSQLLLALIFEKLRLYTCISQSVLEPIGSFGRIKKKLTQAKYLDVQPATKHKLKIHVVATLKFHFIHMHPTTWDFIGVTLVYLMCIN